MLELSGSVGVRWSVQTKKNYTENVLVTHSLTEERREGCAVMNQQGDDAAVLQQPELMAAYLKCWPKI